MQRLVTKILIVNRIYLLDDLYSSQLPQREKVQSYVVALIFLVLLYKSPAGLVLYWTVNNLISVFKSLIYSTGRTRAISELKPC